MKTEELRYDRIVRESKSAAPTIMRKTGDIFKHADDIDDGKQWLAELVNRARSGLISEPVILSPSRAQALLDANPGNRTISEALVDTIAADILAGRWAFNGESIIVSDTGEMNDGQHRCCGVVRAGKAIETLLVAGVPRKARTTVDTGKARGVQDFLAMNGIGDPNHTAAIAAILFAFSINGVSKQKGARQANIFKTSAKPTKAAILSYARANLADIDRGRAFIQNNCTKVCSYSRLVAMLILIARATGDWDGAANYIQALVSGESLKVRSAAYVARERLLKEKMDGTQSPVRAFEIILRGWNFHRTKQSIRHITITGELPQIAT